MNVKNQSEVAQLCPTLSDLMDCNLPGSSIHGIFQARVLWCLEHDNYSCVFHKKGLGGGSIHTPLFKLYLLQFIFLSYILLTLKYILLNSIFDFFGVSAFGVLEKCVQLPHFIILATVCVLIFLEFKYHMK